jgi:hypothetical protein
MEKTFVAAALGGSRPIDAVESQYELLELGGGAVVYAFTGFPKHYACPHCFAKHVIHVLQYRRIGSGYFECPGCKTSFPVKQSTRTDVARLAQFSVE